MTTFDTEDLQTELNTIHNKLDKSMETTNEVKETIIKSEHESHTHIPKSGLIPRPRTLEDFEKDPSIQVCSEEPSFTFSGLDSDEELLLIDIPRTINPLDLKGLVLQVGEKSKFKIKEESYCAISKNNNASFTCVFNIDDDSTKYKAVNIKPHKIIKIRKKLSNIPKKKFEVQKSEGVPYPKNIKQRHPFFGVQESD